MRARCAARPSAKRVLPVKLSFKDQTVSFATARRELMTAIRDYSLKGVASRITCLTLIMHGEGIISYRI